ncbi:MAG: sigma 54-interacting transcriptional regulator [Desulfobacterales bacterium]|nr:sigma 54-interacting transcriptional regulator [Desulfobacterales bacterium]
MAQHPVPRPDYLEMKSLLDQLNISYWLVDPRFRLLDVNANALSLTGARRTSLLGRDMLSLVHEQEADRIKAALAESDQASHQFDLELRGLKDKADLPVRFLLTMNRDSQGCLVSYNILLSDISIQRSLEAKERELSRVRREMEQRRLHERMVGTGRAMEAVFYAIQRCAEVETPVLITGETGVGKEMAARAIHDQGRRRNHPFVAVNCGALPGDLLESELFGHVKGAFTGAVSDRPGLFREAQGGTLFLDEIGDMEKRLQVKLLRALQDREVRPVGQDQFHPVDLRLICATHHDLKAEADSGRFRLDLYYRISVIPIHIPPLRERPEDIIKLAEQFIRNRSDGTGPSSISPPARRLLCRYPWPGNIRELQNAVEHAMVMSRDRTLEPHALPEAVQGGGESPLTLPVGRASIRSLKEETEKQALVAALDRHGGNQTAAARELGISRTTLWRKRGMLGI